jgi:hypothetical protein
MPDGPIGVLLGGAFSYYLVLASCVLAVAAIPVVGNLVIRSERDARRRPGLDGI